MILLKNGFIVDGTGSKGYTGNLLMNGDVIEDISGGHIAADCESIDCTGKVIAPGFIDLHSHNDWFLPSGNADFTKSFLEQGITTFVGGNCGFGAAGFRKDTRYLDLLENNLFKAGHDGITWRSLDEYFFRLEEKGAHPQPGNARGAWNDARFHQGV